MSRPNSDREGQALAAVYDLLREVARRHSEQTAALIEAERTPKPQPDDEDELQEAA